jgi:hypothetical protein
MGGEPEGPATAGEGAGFALELRSYGVLPWAAAAGLIMAQVMGGSVGQNGGRPIPGGDR